MNDLFSFELIAKSGRARAGIFHTPHGDLRTPVFAPVGTSATVKSLTPRQLQELNASLVLANTYHLYLRPGDQIIADLGGLHSFMNWSNPILTDSGGFQVFSLGRINEINDDGVIFKSHIDGSTHCFTPEKSIAIQENLGADIIMTFDECAEPYDLEYNKQALRRTHSWAVRCRNAKKRPDQALFGIIQGGVFPDLRKKSADFISSLDFPGIAIGGLSVGETKEEMLAVIDWVEPILPVKKPRYLMGVGTPQDLLLCIMRGIDIFDCVLPTRLARHKAAFTWHGRINMANAKHARSEEPIVDDCNCYTCQYFSRAYLRHLIVSKEILASTLLSIHNLHILLQLTQEIQQAIIENRLENYVNDYFQKSNANVADNGF